MLNQCITSTSLSRTESRSSDPEPHLLLVRADQLLIVSVLQLPRSLSGRDGGVEDDGASRCTQPPGERDTDRDRDRERERILLLQALWCGLCRHMPFGQQNGTVPHCSGPPK